MPSECAAANCKELHTADSQLSFHRFPNRLKKPNLFKEWINRVNRQDNTGNHIDGLWRPQQHDLLCSKHFDDSCFTGQSKEARRKEMRENTGRKVRMILEENAVPTKFDRGKRILELPDARGDRIKKRSDIVVSHTTTVVAVFIVSLLSDLVCSC